MRIIEKSSDKIFFTADLHFGLEWLISFNNRPYQSVQEMDDALIANWNQTVPPDGLVFVLGDIGFTFDDRIREVFAALHGDKILIRGNHDLEYAEETLRTLFVEIHDMLYLAIRDDRIGKFDYMVLCHYPMLDW